MYSFRGRLYMPRFQGYDGFLGWIRFDNPWLWAGLAALVLLRIPLRICLSRSLMADRNVKRILGLYTLLTCILILAALVICADNFPN